MIEASRYKWAELRAMGNAALVPDALSRLMFAQNTDEAGNAYWQIDNTVVVQGSLYEAAVPTVVCILSALYTCSDVARPYLLELLEVIGSGEPAPSEISAGNPTIKYDCLREMCYGASLYFNLLENGTREEMMWCVDILLLCVECDEAIKERVVWWYQSLLARELEPSDRSMIEASLKEILS